MDWSRCFYVSVVVQILLCSEAIDQAASGVHTNNEMGIHERDFLNALSRTEDKEEEDVACGLVKICLYYG